MPLAICCSHELCMSSRVSLREDCMKEQAEMLRQAEKRQHRGACALSVIENVSVVQRSAKGERAVGPAVCEAESARGRHRESRQAEERQHTS